MRGVDVVPDCDILWLVFDTLRFDAAQEAFQLGVLPTLSQFIAPHGWERRHAPGSFTFPSHQAMFAGFLPTPDSPGPHMRAFAMPFPGSESTNEATRIFSGHSIIDGLGEFN